MIKIKENQKALFKKHKKVSKSYVVLKLYDTLKSDEPVFINYFCLNYDISVPTFRRYLAFVREYLWENYLIEVVYDKLQKCYRISK